MVEVLQHSRFFDTLVELIPAKFYHAGDEEHVDLRTMKKAARAAVKQEFKAKAKENKLAKFDPDAPATALEVQQSKQKQAADEQPFGAGTSLNLSGGKLTREELKEKLHKKLEVRAQAGAGHAAWPMHKCASGWLALGAS